ncbi:MAG TPA: hypothetical protein VF796_00200, partial [Humisphaera sp.]
MTDRFVDRLEPRALFAAGGPQVTSELLVGNVDAVTAVVIGFDSQLEPLSAVNPDNFLFAGSRGGGRTVHDTPFVTPVYDDGARTVTLTFTKPLTLTRFKRLKIVVRGEETRGVRGADGTLLDGNRDGVPGEDSDSRYKIYRGTKFSYKDADGDKVTLRARGAKGRPMTTLFGPTRNVTQVWLAGTGNRITGDLRQRKLSLGVTPIARVTLQDPTNTSDLASPT